MNDNTTLLYATFTILVVPAGGAMLLFVTRRHRMQHQPHWLLPLLAAEFLLVSGIGMVTVVGWGLHGNAEPGDLIPCLVADSMMMMMMMVVGWSGWQAMRVSRLTRPEMSPSEQLDLAERTGMLQTAAWCQVGLPLLFVAPLAIPICVVMFVLIEGPASARHAKRGHLLWLLAIAVRRQQPLPPLLDSFGESLSGDQAFSIWRFAGFRKRSRFRMSIGQLADRLRSGFSLPDALADCPRLLPLTTLVTIRVGHESDCLAESLEREARRHSQSARQTDAISGISMFFVYAAVVFLAIISLCSFQMVFVVPKLKAIFESFDVELPAITHNLIHTSDMMASHLLLANTIMSLPCLLLILLGISWFWGLENLRIPWLTRCWPRVHSAGIFRSLSLALEGSRPLDQAISVQIHASQGPDVAVRLERVRQAVVAGDSGWAAMRTERMINSREESVLDCAQRLGNLPWALQLIADSAERRLQRRMLWAFQVARPVIILTLGVLVAYFCIALFLPLLHVLAEQAQS